MRFIHLRTVKYLKINFFFLSLKDDLANMYNLSSNQEWVYFKNKIGKLTTPFNNNNNLNDVRHESSMQDYLYHH